MKDNLNYALNLFAFGTFSPVNTRSAPTFFPFAGHPYLGPNTLFQTLQEVMVQIMVIRKMLLINKRAFMSVASFL